jgi:hypothetical protein
MRHHWSVASRLDNAVRRYRSWANDLYFSDDLRENAKHSLKVIINYELQAPLAIKPPLSDKEENND